MKRTFLLAIAPLVSALFLALPAQADWSVTETSRVGFVSIKNNVIGENNAFQRVSGHISDAGEVMINIDLASVETGVGIRNERLQKMLFDVASYPSAKVEARLSSDQLASLNSGGNVSERVNLSISLHGKSVSKVAELVAMTSGQDVRVTSVQPIVITAAEFGLESGVAALQAIAGLNAISRSIPVTIDLRLSKD